MAIYPGLMVYWCSCSMMWLKSVKYKHHKCTPREYPQRLKVSDWCRILKHFFSSLATQDQSLEGGGKSAAIGDATSTN